jgi:hypothetical protein
MLQLAVLRGRLNGFKDLEIVVLRHELAILRRGTRRPAMSWTDRLCLAAASRVLSRAQWRAFVVTPDTDVGVNNGRQGWLDKPTQYAARPETTTVRHGEGYDSVGTVE